MGTPAKQRISTLTAEQLLGPLNDVERKYAPVRLYAAGPIQIPLPRPRAAIIGSRKASKKALDVAAEISKTLAKKKVIIVSGLAEGIDTAGHRAAIEAGGKTVAVLGTPLDQVWEALRLGRPLFIWTDLLKSSLNWPKRMLRYGALELTSPEQVLDVLPSAERILIKIAR